MIFCNRDNAMLIDQNEDYKHYSTSLTWQQSYSAIVILALKITLLVSKELIPKRVNCLFSKVLISCKLEVGSISIEQMEITYRKITVSNYRDTKRGIKKWVEKSTSGRMCEQ